MKKVGHILALVAVMVALAGTASAAQFIHESPLKWDRGAGEDSVWISIPVWGGAVATATAEDTTVWLDLGKYQFPEGTNAATAIPLVQFAVMAQVTTGASAVTSDSVGYIVQYTNDPSYATRTTGFQGSTLAYSANSGGTANWVLDAWTSVHTAAATGRFVRLIIRNAEVGSGTQRRFRVVPIIHGSR
jgi:hypothetical protein